MQHPNKQTNNKNHKTNHQETSKSSNNYNSKTNNQAQANQIHKPIKSKQQSKSE